MYFLFWRVRNVNGGLIVLNLFYCSRTKSQDVRRRSSSSRGGQRFRHVQGRFRRRRRAQSRIPVDRRTSAVPGTYADYLLL